MQIVAKGETVFMESIDFQLGHQMNRQWNKLDELESYHT